MPRDAANSMYVLYFTRVEATSVKTTQIEREGGADAMECAKVFQFWVSGPLVRFVIQKCGIDLGTNSYIYIYICIYMHIYMYIYSLSIYMIVSFVVSMTYMHLVVTSTELSRCFSEGP